MGVFRYKPESFDRKTMEQEEQQLEPLSWWDSEWSYYKSCYITNPLENYQIRIVVGNNSGGNVTCEGHVQNDFDDIRFLRTDNSTEFSFWCENYTDSDQATFWVNNTHNDSEILLYYGNDTAATASNGVNTMFFIQTFRQNASRIVTVRANFNNRP